MKFILLYFFIFIFIGKNIIAQEVDPKWITFFEKSDSLSTPDYDQSIDYFKQFEKYSPYVKIEQFGISPQGRKLFAVIVSKNKNYEPVPLSKRSTPVILIDNGIHSGEIEGKDACMLLLREILITKENFFLLDHCDLVIIPVFNIDGHERKSAYNRINQNGPTEMGWRTTSQNINLNRDFMKADAPEMKYLLSLFNYWLPDFFVDTHTTNGADYQYSITYAIEKNENMPAQTAKWINDVFVPHIESDVPKKGFQIMNYVDFKERDINKGIVDWATPPRFSHGYAAAQNRPGLLIETHMLKPYKERVLSTKALLISLIELVNKNHQELLSLNKTADEEVMHEYYLGKKSYPIKLELSDEYEIINYKGIEAEYVDSWITGKKIIRYTGKKYEREMPFYNKMKIKYSSVLPDYYHIPQEYKNLVDVAKLHGVTVSVLQHDTILNVERYKFSDVKFSSFPFENRFIPTFTTNSFNDNLQARKGDYIINTNQRTLRIIAHLFEPSSDDSFIKWGFMNSIFEPKEYFEDYAMEPIAQKMAEENPDLKKEFLEKLEADEKFRNNPRRRLAFFYERSKYFDEKLNVYPISRVFKERK